jgi:peptide/nickel transport system substrate-binding protein
MSVVDPARAVERVADGSLDVYGGLLESAADWDALAAAGLESDPVYNRFYEIALNPAVIDNEKKGQLNPFSDARIREALNTLVNRDEIADAFFGGNARPKFTPLTAGLADARRYEEQLAAVAGRYAYDEEACRAVVVERMQAMGAVLQDGAWTYGGKAVSLTFLIRSDDTAARGIGDYLSDRLEALGFKVDRKYVTAGDAAGLWLGTNPADGKWNLATVVWRVDAAGRELADSRDGGGDFEFYMSADSIMSYYPLWRYYSVGDELRRVFSALSRREYHSADERDGLFAQAIDGSMTLSYRIFLVDAAATACRRPGVSYTGNQAAGLAAGDMTPFTLRFAGQEGGDLSWGTDALFGGAVNPVAGTTSATALTAVLFTRDHALLTDETGLKTAQRIASATLTVRGDLCVEKAADSPWLTLERAGDSIQVPSDAYIGWDAENGVWITVGEAYPDGLKALTKSVVTYEDLAGVTWHDGSAMTAADFMMAMIVRFDRADARSALYDPEAAREMEEFIGFFRGFRIVSVQPLTIEYYTDAYTGDAENCVATLWPEGTGVQAAWHLLAVCNLTEIAGDTAYGRSKAVNTKAEWTNLLYGPSLEMLRAACQQALDESYIPYAATMSQYVTPEEAAERYRNLLDFYAAHGHFVIGTGPYVLDSVDVEGGTCTLVNNDEFVDVCDRWTRGAE